MADMQGHSAGWISKAERPVGILMLDTAFPRPVGDVGNANSHRFPCLFERISGARASDIVGLHSAEQIAAQASAFEAAAQSLVARGAVLIGTSCGFLAPLQTYLQARLAVPVALSALLQVRMLEPIHGRGRIGVITFDAATLTTGHLRAAGIEGDLPIIGLGQRSTLRRAILDNEAVIDHESARHELAGLAAALRHRHPTMTALVLECTNLPPYRRAISQACGLPVYDVNTMLDWIWSGLRL